MKKKFDVESIKKKIVRKYPIMGSLMDNIKFNIIESEDPGQTAYTDGRDIYFNRTFMDTLDEKEQIFVFAHEMSHIALDHIMRSDGKDPQLWNIATDAVINQELLRDRLLMPEGCINIKDALNHSAEWVYRKLLEKRQELMKESSQQSSQNDKNQSSHEGQQSKQQSGQQGGQQQGQQGDQSAQENQDGQGQSSQNSQGGQGQQGSQDNPVQSGQQSGNQDQSGQQGEQSEQSGQQGGGGQSDQVQVQSRQGQQGGQGGQSGGATSQNAQSEQEQSNGQDGQSGQDVQGGNQGGNGGKTGDGNLDRKKSQGRSGIKNKKPTSIEDMDLSDFQEDISNHGKWADTVKEVKEEEKRKKEQENNSQSNNNQQAEKNKDDQNPRIDGKDKDIKTDGKSASQEKHESVKGEMNKDKNNQDQTSKSKKADKEQRKKDKKLNKRKLKDTKFGGEEKEGQSHNQQNDNNGEQDQNNSQSETDQKNQSDRKEKQSSQAQDKNFQNQDREKEQDQNNQNQNKSDKIEQHEGMAKPISHDETDFFSKNRDKVFEQASQVVSARGSRGYGMGNTEAMPSSITFSDIGQVRKGVVNWRNVLKRNFEKVEDKWDYDDYPDPNDPYMRRKIYEVEKDEKATTEVICDVSGSVSHDLIKCFLRQIKSMIKETSMKVGFFADYFYGFTEVKKVSDIDNLRIPVGYGTDFDSASRAFTNDRDVNKICFTDGWDGGDARIAHKRKDIIWISFENQDFKPDYGKVIYVPKEKIYETEMKLLGDKNSFDDNDRNI